MTDASAGRSRTFPLLLLILGGLALGYGQLILAPPAPSAAWTGVLDSARAGKPGRSFPGSDASRTITLHLQGQSTGRTFSVPAGAPLTADQLKAGDTIRALVGWGRFRDLPAALSLTAAGTELVDSARVLPAQRSQANRLSLLGAALLLLGLGLVFKGRRAD